jgi:hypothetical protein
MANLKGFKALAGAVLLSTTSWCRSLVPKRRLKVERYGTCVNRPPPMSWSPCHPATIKQFKATMACPKGHLLTLKIHSIQSNGLVNPSVICPEVDCSFHAYGPIR